MNRTIVTEAPTAVNKRTLPKPSRRETYAAGCCRLAHQGRLNGATVTRPTTDYHWGPTWFVTSQSGPGGYTVTHFPPALYADMHLPGTWECGCEAHTGGKLCSHIALVRTWETECPVCSAPLLVYADAENCGAVRCTGVCGFITTLHDAEAAALYEEHYQQTDRPVNVLGLLLHVAYRVNQQTSEAA